jgi:hypothetical protein
MKEATLPAFMKISLEDEVNMTSWFFVEEVI